MYFCSATRHFCISKFRFCTFIIYLQRHTSQNIDYKDNNTGCSDYCENIFVVGHNFVVSTKCIDPRVLEFVVSNTTGNNQWENCISLDFIFLWFILLLFFFYYIYITPVNNLPLGARKPQRFTNIYNEQYN